MGYYLSVLKNYVGFSKRARRKEYWMFVLFNAIFGIIVTALDNILGITYNNCGYGVLYTVYVIALLLPSLAVSVRRMHDINRSGFWILIGLIPIVGLIWFIVLACGEGTKGDNKYGADPKAVV